MLAYRPIILVFPLLILGMVIADLPRDKTSGSKNCCPCKNNHNTAPTYHGIIPNIPNFIPNIPNFVPNIPNFVPNIPNFVPNIPNYVPNIPNFVPNIPNFVPNIPNFVPNIPNIGPNKQVLPADYEPNNLPADYEPNKLPADHESNKLPADYEPNKLPADYEPNNLPADFEPNNLPADFEPNKLPPDYQSNKLPADRLINPLGPSCVAPSYLCHIGKPNFRPAQRDDYNYTSGMGYHKFHTRSKTWNEARKVCGDEGAHLAIINSEAEMKILRELWLQAGPTKDAYLDNKYKLAYIGTHDLYKEGDWVTVLGESLSRTGYTGWSNNYGKQPDNGHGIQHCGALFQDGTGMDDISCDVKFPFFCEIPERCIPH